MKVIKIKEKVFRRLTVVFVGSREEMQKWHKKQYGCESPLGKIGFNGGCSMVANDNDGFSIQFIWLEKFDNSIESIKILSHELNHATFVVLDTLGIQDDKMNEAHCYYQDFLLGECLDKLIT